MKRSDIRTKNPVNVATLKAQLAKYLRIVRGGEEVVVLDHKMPVAKIVPFDSSASTFLETIKPQGAFLEVAQMKIPPLEKKGKWNSLALLLEERGSR
ncbi:MAG: type II toxin-antitoxin system Phd/YefM family antitoxin [Deltaproteobacteria bacterium]|nr:type II toxin-antitoxin system Phd/YefM family antitoxin [Deltaproteobacteria bacterium]